MTNKPTLVLLALTMTAGGLLASACAPEARIRYAEPPKELVFVGGDSTLVAIDTNVWVVRDADHPVYFVDGSYWTIDEKHKWFRSASYEAEWSAVDADVVPHGIVNRNHGYYTQYHGEATALTMRPPVGDGQPGNGQTTTTSGTLGKRVNLERPGYASRGDANNR
jgi:hypothetical protein